MGIYYCLIAFVPLALQTIVPLLSAYLTPDMIYLALFITTLLVMTVVYNTVMYFVYTLKLPFFEQYRVNKDVSNHTFRNLGLGKKTLINGGILFGGT